MHAADRNGHCIPLRHHHLQVLETWPGGSSRGLLSAKATTSRPARATLTIFTLQLHQYHNEVFIVCAEAKAHQDSGEPLSASGIKGQLAAHQVSLYLTAWSHRSADPPTLGPVHPLSGVGPRTVSCIEQFSSAASCHEDKETRCI